MIATMITKLIVLVLILVACNLAVGLLVLVGLWRNLTLLRAFDVDAVAKRMLALFMSTPFGAVTPRELVTAAAESSAPAKHAFEGDAHCVAVGHDVHYHGPSREHAERVFAQLEERGETPTFSTVERAE